MIRLTVTDYPLEMTTNMWSISPYHKPVFTSFMTYRRVCNKRNTTGATSGAGTAYLPEHMISLPVFSGVCVARSLVFCVVFCRSLSFCPFSFGYCMVCPSIYGFWLSLWVSACIRVLILYIGPQCDFNARGTSDISYVVFGVLPCIGLVILQCTYISSRALTCNSIVLN